MLDYITTQEDAVMTYKASEMKLTVHSDASYLREPNARIREGGHFSCQAILKCPTTTEQFSKYRKSSST